ncbi:unnamed protein product, partial [Protopolystoma xenopodis]
MNTDEFFLQKPIDLGKLDKYGLHIYNGKLSKLVDFPFNLPMIYNESKNIIILNNTVLAFIHIQKTGGSLYEDRLVRSGFINKTCLCTHGTRRCSCRNSSGNTWIFSRFSTGWSCGLHADFTELIECIDHKLTKIDGTHDQRQYYFITLLREPTSRYLSEWLHVRRGATWSGARLSCSGQRISIPRTYQPCSFFPVSPLPNSKTGEYAITSGHFLSKDRNVSSRLNVTLLDFLSCEMNLAANRQTRMLADLRLLGCYTNLKSWCSPVPEGMVLSNAQSSLLHSAIENLDNFKFHLHTRYPIRKKRAQYFGIAFFGLMEFPVLSQYLLQQTIGLTFKHHLSEFTPKSFPKSKKTSLWSILKSRFLLNNNGMFGSLRSQIHHHTHVDRIIHQISAKEHDMIQ